MELFLCFYLLIAVQIILLKVLEFSHMQVGYVTNIFIFIYIGTEDCQSLQRTEGTTAKHNKKNYILKLEFNSSYKRQIC